MSILEDGDEALGSSARFTGFVATKAAPKPSWPFSGYRPFDLTSRMRPLIGIQPARYTASPRFRPPGAVGALSTIIVALTTKLPPYGAR